MSFFSSAGKFIKANPEVVSSAISAGGSIASSAISKNGSSASSGGSMNLLEKYLGPLQLKADSGQADKLNETIKYGLIVLGVVILSIVGYFSFKK